MTKATTSTEEPRTGEASGIRRSLVAVAITGVVASVAAAVLAGSRPAASVAVGALFAAANLWAIALVVRGLLGQKRGSTPWALIAVLKFGFLIGALYLLLKSGWVELLPLLVGYGALPVGIVAGQIGAREPAVEET